MCNGMQRLQHLMLARCNAAQGNLDGRHGLVLGELQELNDGLLWHATVVETEPVEDVRELVVGEVSFRGEVLEKEVVKLQLISMLLNP